MDSLFDNNLLFNQTWITSLEQRGLIKRTFRRLDTERQKIIIQAILDESAQKGPQSINIKEIARRANVSVGSLYQYFGNRDGLLDFAIELVVYHTLALFKSSIPYLEAMPIKEALPVYLFSAEEWNRDQRGIYQFFLKAAYDGDPVMQERVVRPIAVCVLDMTRAIIRAAIQRGEIRSDLNMETFSRLMNILLIGLGDSFILPHLNTYYQAVDKDISPSDLVNTLIDFLKQP